LETYIQKYNERIKQAINFETFTHFTSFRRSTFIIVVLSIEISLKISYKKQDKRSIETIIKPSRIVPRYERKCYLSWLDFLFRRNTNFRTIVALFGDHREIHYLNFKGERGFGSASFYTSKIRIRCYSSYMRSNCSTFYMCTLYNVAGAF